MAIDISQLLTDIGTASSGVLQKSLSDIRGFSESQLKAIAQQTVIVAEALTSQIITPDTRDFFISNLEDLVTNFLAVLRGLLAITIQNLFNAIVGVLFKAISAVTGLVIE